MDYWEECISEAFEDAGLSATKEQIDIVTSWVEGSHDNYSMAHGHDCIPNPLATENEQLKIDLKKEKDKITCPDCKGNGYTVSYGGTFMAESRCSACQGEGRRLP